MNKGTSHEENSLQNHKKTSDQSSGHLPSEVRLEQLSITVHGQQKHADMVQKTNDDLNYSVCNPVSKGIGEEPTPEEYNAQNNSIISTNNTVGQKLHPSISRVHSKTYRTSRRYKAYWKIFTVITSLILAGYLGVEVYSLNALAQGKSVEDESNPTVKHLMEGFSQLENLLFVNLYLNLIAYLIGMIIVLYSVILVLIENDQPWKWLKGRHRKIARWGYLLFMICYVIGGLIQMGFVLANRQDKTIKGGLNFFVYTIIRGIVFYFNMCCFRKIEKFKFVQTEVFKDAIGLNNIKMIENPENLEQNWKQLYDNFQDEDTENPQPDESQEETEIHPQIQLNSESFYQPELKA